MVESSENSLIENTMNVSETYSFRKLIKTFFLLALLAGARFITLKNSLVIS